MASNGGKNRTDATLLTGTMTKRNQMNDETFLSKDDEALPPTSFKIAQGSSSKKDNQLQELANVHLIVQKLKGGSNGISKENQDILSQVIAKNDTDDSKNKRKVNSESNISSKFSKELSILKHIILNDVDQKIFGDFFDTFKCTVEFARPHMKLSEESNLEEILHHLENVSNCYPDPSMNMLLFYVLLNQLHLSILGKGQEYGSWELFIADHFQYFETIVHFKPMALLAGLYFSIKKATHECKTFYEFEYCYLQNLNLLQSIFERFHKWIVNFDPSYIALILLTLFVSMILAYEKTEELSTSIAHLAFGKFVDSTFTMYQLKADSVFEKFAILVSRFSSDKSRNKALELWLDLIKAIPLSMNKFKWHVFYMALKQADDFTLPTAGKIATQADVIAQLQLNMARISKDSNEINCLIYIMSFLMIPVTSVIAPKELLKVIQQLSAIKANRISAKALMMLATMRTHLEKRSKCDK